MGKGVGFSRGLLSAMVSLFASFNLQKTNGQQAFFPRPTFREGTPVRRGRGRRIRPKWVQGNKLLREIESGTFTKNKIR